MTLFFLRHGETAYNAEGRVTGQIDIPLAPRGHDQAAAAGRGLLALAKARGIDPRTLPFIVSPLRRTRETAEIARTAMGLAPYAYSLDPRLMELMLGLWENLTSPEIAARYPQSQAKRRADPWNVAPPEGETYADLAVRVGAALGDAPRPAVLVAHAGTGRAVLADVCGVDHKAAATLRIEQGRVLVIEAGKWAWM